MRAIELWSSRATLFSFVIFLFAFRSLAADRDGEISWIDQQIRELQPAPHEKRFDEIGWAPDIRAALALAKHHQRPVFLFTHDGRINTGRC